VTAIVMMLALVVLAMGSFLMLIMFLGNPPGPVGPDDSIKGTLIALQFAWPLVLLVTGVLGGVAVLLGGRPNNAAGLVVVAGVLYIVARSALPRLIALNQGHLPLRGLPALLCVGFFVALNAAAGYSAWHLLVSPLPGTITPSPDSCVLASPLL
jgi:hypothetical protein